MKNRHEDISSIKAKYAIQTSKSSSSYILLGLFYTYVYHVNLILLSPEFLNYMNVKFLQLSLENSLFY